MDARLQPDGSRAALFAAEACRAVAGGWAALLVPQAELLSAGLTSARQGQHLVQPQRDEQRWSVARPQDGAAVSVPALLLVLEASLSQAELLAERRAVLDALQPLQRQASQLAWPSPQQQLSAFQPRPALQHLPERGNAFLLSPPGHCPANSSASSFQ